MKSITKRIDRLTGYTHILRGLISYHKRMTAVTSGTSPSASALTDEYLGALEESLRLIENEIAVLKRRCHLFGK